MHPTGKPNTLFKKKKTKTKQLKKKSVHATRNIIILIRVT